MAGHWLFDSLYWIELRRSWKAIVVLVVINFFETLGLLFLPYNLSKIVDVYIANSNTSALIMGCLAITVVAVLSAFFGYISSTRGVKEDLRFQRSLLGQYSAGIIDTPTVSRCVNDKDTFYRLSRDLFDIQALVPSQTANLFSASIRFLLVVFIALIWDFLLTISLLVLIPISIYLFRYFKVKSTKLNRITTKKFSKFSSLLQELIKDNAQLNSNVAGKFVLNKVTNSLDHYIDNVFRLSLLNFRLATVMGVFPPILISIIWLFGGLAVINSQASMGEIFGILFLLGMLYQPVSEILVLGSSLPADLVKVDRLTELESVGGDTQQHCLDMLSTPIICIELDTVSLTDGDTQILHPVNLTVNQKELLHIKGNNGAGKSALGKIMSGLDHRYTGGVYYNGKELKSLERLEINNKIGIIHQNPEIYSGTLEENIHFSNDCQRPEQLAEVVEKCGLSHLAGKNIKAVHSSDALLSGGEVKRLSIARVLYRRPEVLILDEPLNHIDRAGYELVKKLITDYFRNQIVILISHAEIETQRIPVTITLEKGVLKENVRG